MTTATTKMMKTTATKWTLLTAALVLTASAPTHAQTVFVDGAAFAGVELRNGSDGQSTPGSETRVDLNGTVAGGAVGIGTMLTPRVSARVEVGLPANLERSVDEGLFIPTVVLPFPPYTLRREVWDRARTVSVLIGYHTDRHHGVQLAFVGGAAFVQRTIRQRTRYSFPLIEAPDLAAWTRLGLGLTVPAELTDFTTTSYSVAATVGLDADVALGSRLSVVPQIRAIGLDQGLSVRPGVALRVKF